MRLVVDGGKWSKDIGSCAHMRVSLRGKNNISSCTYRREKYGALAICADHLLTNLVLHTTLMVLPNNAEETDPPKERGLRISDWVTMSLCV